jgi:hypothetical protein
VTIVFAILILEAIPLLALVDCFGREGGEFPGGADDRRAWILWLWVAVATAWFLVGNGIVLGYYYAVVRRNAVRN